MAFTPGRIHLGAARIFVGGTAATTGTPPTYTTHTDGVPSGFTEMGLTQGTAIFGYKPTEKKIRAEQALGPVGTFTVSEDAFVECTVLEQTYTTLQRAFNNVGKESTGSGEAFYFGGGTAILSPLQQCVILTARQPAAPTKFIVVQLYKCSMPNGYEVPFGRENESAYKLRFEAIQVMTRDAGDQMGYYRFEL
jgi:hypothetical protein